MLVHPQCLNILVDVSGVYGEPPHIPPRESNLLICLLKVTTSVICCAYEGNTLHFQRFFLLNRIKPTENLISDLVFTAFKM